MPISSLLADHYRQLLGLSEPWMISDIELQVFEQRLTITLAWPEGNPAPCPTCGASCRIKDHSGMREWRYLDTIQFMTIIRCSVPRADCPTHGVHTITTPWGAPNV